MRNCKMLLTALSRMGINIDDLILKVQEDDSLIALLERLHESLHPSCMGQFVHYAKEYFGAILNTKKSSIVNSLDGLPVLGSTNHAGIPTRPKEELLANVLCTEQKFNENPLMARCLGIAYANCGYRPQVYRVCEDIYLFLESLGYSPNPRGLPHFIPTIEGLWDIFTKYGELKFPSYYETFSRLTCIPERSENRKKERGQRQFSFRDIRCLILVFPPNLDKV